MTTRLITAMSGWTVGFALIALSGCSVQTAYNNLDRLVRWSVDDYVDLTREQRQWFDQQFVEVWDWHRRAHLPEYAVLLEQMAERVDDGVDAAYLDSVAERAQQWFGELQERGLPMAAQLLASLSDDQLAYLADALERSNEELAERELGVTVATAQQRWRDELGDRFRRFTGRLTPMQRAYLDQQARHYRPERVQWADYRRRLQVDFLERLERRDDVDALQRDLAQLMAQRSRYFGVELTAVNAHNERLGREISVWLINSLNERQRERLRDRLQGLADALRILAAADRRGAAGATACPAQCPDGGG